MSSICCSLLFTFHCATYRVRFTTTNGWKKQIDLNLLAFVIQLNNKMYLMIEFIQSLINQSCRNMNAT